MNVSLTNTDIEKLTGQPPMLYEELKNYKTINKLLPKVGSFKILLLRQHIKSGHWVLLYRTKKSYIYVNSYGDCFDLDMRQNMSPEVNHRLNDDANDLTRLLKGKRVFHLTERLQGEDSNTCGRWSILFLEYLKQGFTVNDIARTVRIVADDNALTPDQLVVKMIRI